LQLQIFDAEATFGFWSLNNIPGNKAFGAMTGVFARPKESSHLFVHELGDCFWHTNSIHEVKGKGAKNRGAEHEPTGSVKKGGLPTGEVLVSGGD
jgi:hypothetical protein